MKTGRKILVVEDERKIVDVVRSYLEHEGYEVHAAYDGEQAMLLFDKEQPSLVILDLMLPDITGEDICKAIRKQSRVPVIMLTAKVEEEDILKGLDIGADDYVTKPFSPRQLVARVTAVMRRVVEDTAVLSNMISFNNGDLTVDNLRHEVKKRGQPVYLTPNEYRILQTLMKYPKKAFTREELIDIALGEDFDGFDRTIDTHIKNLRQKIEGDPKHPQYIQTVFGVGYKFGGE